MCEDCWSRYEPVPVTPAIKTAVAWLCALYEHHPTGGWLHVWVDDWNLPLNTELADEVRESEEHAARIRANIGTASEMDPPDDVETACWNIFKALTEAEQATALAIYNGYHLREETVSTLRLENGIWGDHNYWPPEVIEAIGREPYTLSTWTDPDPKPPAVFQILGGTND